ncbi:hypothetical protein SYNTR_0755 [Candidatus Syntrophocurvum alkaliphilum]|uniref:Triacylglycerol lipase n=1 Tax=Candidatus Syntrophocurvum alkaliphilum TaxID=2293317 RepID=A0A6I6D8S4_9FIRM|nr:alpha/beta fold hydrolase [Candidatus Syntrophocurvum alkaliphilum]QGT99348.1 hypothetical protein SYNTR_0755 [Candidatus Syntrophocurvum alkaliphilum]
MKKKIFPLFIIAFIITIIFLHIPSTENKPNDKNPVVFVHGYFDTRAKVFNKSNFDPLISYLKDQGWSEDELFVIQYSNIVGCNIDNANELKDFIDDVLAETDSDKVDIVAHSMGGLSSRYYINYLDGAENVGALVTIGSPHHGTPTAYMVNWTKGGEQMIPDSKFLQKLNDQDSTSDLVSYTSIYTYTDQLVPYWYSQKDEWNNIGGWFYTHLPMLYNSKVHKHVANNLS